MIWGQWEQALKWNGGGNDDSIGHVDSYVSSNAEYVMMCYFDSGQILGFHK